MDSIIKKVKLPNSSTEYGINDVRISTSAISSPTHVLGYNSSNADAIGSVAISTLLASPAFTGTPTAPTATAGTNNTLIATTAFVNTAISNSASNVLPTTTTANLVLKSTSTSGTVQWGTLSASDVGALASNTSYVSSVNGSSGAITNIATLNTDLTFTGAKVFTGTVGNVQTSAGVYLGLDTNTNAENANMAIVSANTAAYIDMGRPDVDYDFRIIKWNMSGNTSAQFMYGGNASGTITIPQATGTIALTSQLPTNQAATNGGTTDTLVTTGDKYTWNNKQNSVAKLGSTTKPVYTSAAGTFAECSTYAGGTAVTLNGSSKAGSSASFYAPTSYGTSGYYLKSNGSGSAPTWTSFPTIPSKMSDVATISVTTISADTSSSCSITGSGNAGKSQTIIYTNSSGSDKTVTVPTTYTTPNGAAIELTCPNGGYCEVNYLNVSGTIYARGL